MIVQHAAILLATVMTTFSFGADAYDRAIRTFLDEPYPDNAAITILRGDQERAVLFFLKHLDIHNRSDLSVGEPISTKLSALINGSKAFDILPMKWNEKATQQLKSGLVNNLRDRSLTLRAVSCLYLREFDSDLADSTEDLIAETARRAIQAKDEDLRMVGYVVAGSTGRRLVPYLVGLLRKADTLSDVERQELYFCLKDIGPPARSTLGLLQARKAAEKHPQLIEAVNCAIATISGEARGGPREHRNKENQEVTPP